jgi:type VI secretion system secreted protein VgrG
MPGKPAARVTDLTTHGSPLFPGPGSPNTLIGSLPAWRTIIDQHMCPAASITGADGVGFVVIGSPTVFINNQMACRIQDIVVEKPGLAMGPVNPIVMGCVTVLIGETGAVQHTPEVRMAEGKGGAAGPPKPATVTLRYNQGIVIKGPQEFVEKAKAHLDEVAKTETGKGLLASLAKSGKETTVVPSRDGTNSAIPKNWKGALARDKALKFKSRSDGKQYSLTGEGTGSDSTVQYNPDRTELPPAKDGWQKRPPAIGLAHELVHADDAAHGRLDPGEKDKTPNYERQAVGLPPFEDKAFTENKIRDEWDPKQPHRPRY